MHFELFVLGEQLEEGERLAKRLKKTMFLD